MRDFTLLKYEKLLQALLKADYKFITFADHVRCHETYERTIILRHDVDDKPFRSLRTAEMENELQIKGSYYFRGVKNRLAGEVIAQVAGFGHEIGYHYNDLHDASGDKDRARELFRRNLAKLRELAPVETACMHGSPLSRFDNRELWRDGNYHDYGIIGEPYFDIDFSEVLYLTDTGRRWDGEKVSIRDKVKGNGPWPALHLHSTADIIRALDKKVLPCRIMLTVHPQRWTSNYFFWIKELVWQKFKNLIKYVLLIRMEISGIK
jgi:hypothetical protein